MIDIDWGAFVSVFLVALAATVAIVIFYALGLRLLSGGAMEPDAQDSTASGTSGSATAPSTGARVGAYACFGVGVLAVLYGIYLVVPQFHGG